MNILNKTWEFIVYLSGSSILLLAHMLADKVGFK